MHSEPAPGAHRQTPAAAPAESRRLRGAFKVLRTFDDVQRRRHDEGGVDERAITVLGEVVAQNESAERDAGRQQRHVGAGRAHGPHGLGQVAVADGAIEARRGQRQAAEPAVVEHDAERAQLGGGGRDAAHVVGLGAAREAGQHEQHGSGLARGPALHPVQRDLAAIR